LPENQWLPALALSAGADCLALEQAKRRQYETQNIHQSDGRVIWGRNLTFFLFALIHREKLSLKNSFCYQAKRGGSDIKDSSSIFNLKFQI